MRSYVEDFGDSMGAHAMELVSEAWMDEVLHHLEEVDTGLAEVEGACTLEGLRNM